MTYFGAHRNFVEVPSFGEKVKKVHFCAHPNRDNEGGNDQSIDFQPAIGHFSLKSTLMTSVGIDIVPGDPFRHDHPRNSSRLY